MATPLDRNSQARLAAELPLIARDFVAAAALSGSTFAVALGVATAMTGSGAVPPIAAGLFASLVLAAAIWTLDLPYPGSDFQLVPAKLASWTVGFVIPLALLGVLAWLLPPGSQFVCEPLVPWRISIAVFGAFFTTCLATGLKLRKLRHPYQALIPIALCWIAPFYGFFHPPWFLAQSLMLPCADRTHLQAVIVAAAMTVAALLGQQVMAWLVDRQR